MLIILALKIRWKTVLNNAETNIFRWDMLLSGTSWQCFAMFCDIQQELVILAGTDKCLTSLKMNSIHLDTQVNRMSRCRRVLATGGKQRILGLDMVCIETILFHLDSLGGIRTTYRSIVYRMMITLKTIYIFELNLLQFKSHLNSEMQ